MPVRYVESSRLPTSWGDFEMHGFEDTESNKEHLILTMGNVASGEPVLARVHSECLTGDALFSLRCDCGNQLQAALQAIAREGRGALFYLRQEGRGILMYLRQEGRGIGLLNKIRAYKLQDEGADTVEANEQLGFGADMRDYSMLQAMVAHLGVSAVRLMTNNPRKVAAMEEQGVSVVERIALHTDSNPHNEKYLRTKAGKLGHMFGNDD